jgi:hypothetical protein
MNLEQIICNGFTQWNVETVILSTRQMDQIFGNESAPDVKVGDHNFQ